MAKKPVKIDAIEDYAADMDVAPAVAEEPIEVVAEEPAAVREEDLPASVRAEMAAGRAALAKLAN